MGRDSTCHGPLQLCTCSCTWCDRVAPGATPVTTQATRLRWVRVNSTLRQHYVRIRFAQPLPSLSAQPWVIQYLGTFLRSLVPSVMCFTCATEDDFGPCSRTIAAYRSDQSMKFKSFFHYGCKQLGKIKPGNLLGNLIHFGELGPKIEYTGCILRGGDACI